MGSLQSRRDSRPQDGPDGLTGCCDWRSDGGPEHGACVWWWVLAFQVLAFWFSGSVCPECQLLGEGMDSLIDSGLDFDPVNPAPTHRQPTNLPKLESGAAILIPSPHFPPCRPASHARVVCT